MNSRYPYSITGEFSDERVQGLSQARELEIRYWRGLAFINIPGQPVFKMVPIESGIINKLKLSNRSKATLRKACERPASIQTWTKAARLIGRKILITLDFRDDDTTCGLIMIEAKPKGYRVTGFFKEATSH